MLRITNIVNRKVITKLIERGILDGMTDRQVRKMLLACGYSVNISRIKKRRLVLRDRGCPV